MPFYIAFDKVCNPRAVQIFITGADLCARKGRLASHINWMGLSSRCHSWCSNLSLVKVTAFPSWMPQCGSSGLGTETMSSLSMFAGGDGGTSISVTQKQKVAFKMLVQEKHRTKRHLSVKMKESLFLPSTMMKLFMNSSYFSVSVTHRTHSSCSLKILLGSVKCSVIIHTAIKLVHVNWGKKIVLILAFPWLLYLVRWAKRRNLCPFPPTVPRCPSPPRCPSHKHLLSLLLDLAVLSLGLANGVWLIEKTGLRQCQFEGNFRHHSALKSAKSMLMQHENCTVAEWRP